MSLELIASLILLLPAGASLLAGLGGYVLPATMRHRTAELITSIGMVICALLSAFIFFKIAIQGGETIHHNLFTWLSLSTVDLSFGVMVDKLTAVMLIVVTGVSACVHVYSIGYMHEDPSRQRFMAYLSLFTFAMLSLVMAPNLLQMFLGWEGVGVASYLLIGFWYHKESANAASIKAFITNRVADASLLLGLFTILIVFGSLNYVDVLPNVGAFQASSFSLFGHSIPVLELTALFLFVGAMGKSAQFGLHVWLPDAMEGPTPVSALIHAATMVTAGVFLLCRMSPLYELAPHVLHFVAWVGAITAIFAATVGLTQTDIKRVIAYSTCSQLGYMFFAIGVSAYPAAMFHLTTHAFFKALLFLSAGSVIHALHHEQDLFKMGGVRKLLPVTYGLMWIGSLALAGIPPFAGFFSKDLILESAFGAHTFTGNALYAMGTFGALLTAFYSFRVLFMAFHGKHRGSKEVLSHAHESPWIMLAPMLVLGIGAVLGGWLLKGMGYLEWWNGSIAIAEHHHALHNAHHTPPLPKYAPLAIVLVGIALAVLMYLKKTKLPQQIAKRFKTLYNISLNKWYVDELYSAIVVKPVTRFATILWQKGDQNGIDRYGPNGVAFVTRKGGDMIRILQTGYVYHYAFAIVIGVVVLIITTRLH